MTVQVTRHPVGGRASGLRPGDFVLVRSRSQFAPRLIGFGQRLHHPAEFAYWTHAALYVGTGQQSGTRPPRPGDWLVEAKGKHPVRFVRLGQYDGRDYAAVRFVEIPAASEMRVNAASYAAAQVGDGYGYLTILTLAAWSILGGDFLVGARGKPICSGLVASALTRLGEPFTDPLTMEPADLAATYDVAA